MFFISPIKGYCVSYTGSSVEPFSYILSSSNGSSTDITEGTYTYIGSGVIELKLIAHNLSTSSKTIFANGDYSVYIDTTEGTYLLKSGNVSGTAIAVAGSGTAVITQTISFNNFYLPGAFRSYYISGNVFSYEYNGSMDTYCSFSSATVSGFSHTESHYNTGDYTTILNNIYNELLSQGLTLDNFYTELLDQGISLDTLVKSLCFDFPLSIDGNYQLSTVFISSLPSNITLHNNYLSLGYFGFDFDTTGSGNGFIFAPYFVVPSSRHIRLYSTFSSDIRYVFALNGNQISNYTKTSSSGPESYFTDIVFGDTIPIGSFVRLSIFFDNSSSTYFSGRLALYDYVVGANDILDYMNKQWSGADVEVDPFINEIDTASGVQDSIHIMESGSWSDLNDNYTYTGLGSFSFNAFTGMKALTTIINRFYLKLPSQYALYIVGVMFIGIAAVLISAVGRVNKASDINIKSHLPKMKKGNKG